jgi:hypothetical protein
MEDTNKKCSICNEKATGAIREIPYCKKHFDEMVVTKPIVKTTAIQFRNEPCACGSGKKYKNCCSSKLTDHKPRHYFNSLYINQKQNKAQ